MSRKSSLLSSLSEAREQVTSEIIRPSASSRPENRNAEIPFDDVLQQSGVHLPDHLSTKTSRWISLLTIAISGSFASGPIASWPTLEPILIKEGVFAGPTQQNDLTTLYSFATCVALIAIFIGGIAFDVLGPKAVAVGGAFGAAACLLLMGAAIKIQSLNYLLWFAYPLASLFGFVQSLGSLSWLWLLPDDQNTVNACVGAIQAVSDAFVLVAVFMNSEYGLRLPVYFFLVACLSCLAGLISWAMVPSRQLHRQVSAVVVSYQCLEATNDRDYGAIAELHAQTVSQEDSYWNALYESGSVVKHACYCCARVHPVPTSLFAVYIVFWYMNVATFTFDMYPFYEAFVGKVDAVRLVDIWGILFAFIGAISLFLFGRFVDYAGFVMAFAFAQIPVAAANCLLHFPNMNTQIAAQVLYAFLQNTWSVVIPRFCLSYAPPELIGTLFGLASTAMGVGQIVMTSLSKKVISIVVTHMAQHGYVKPALSYFLAFDFWASLSLVSSLALLVYWCNYPPPQPGSTTMVDILSASTDDPNMRSEDMERALEKMPLQTLWHRRLQHQKPAHTSMHERVVTSKRSDGFESR
mmetsp:Transcript_29565/g.47591  ORF Transcript_29565/g.47591 Transcript_29565/m.47591 type:complete len:579 (+) Transcript_29565:71-1807(+)